MKKKKINSILLWLGLLLILLGSYVIVEPYLIEDIVVEIIDEDIPAAFVDTKLVFVSDIHHGPFFGISRVKKLVRTINAKNPDIILLGGDYVHRSPEYIEPCFNELRKLRAPLGVYGVLGNHDHWEDATQTWNSMEKTGIVLLDNSALWIEKDGGRIKVGGVGDLFEDDQDINPTVKDVNREDFVVLVTHNPDYVETISIDKIDLVFGGHTHGGQVTFFGLWAPLIPSRYGQKYRSGLIELGDMKLIVSNGIGTVTPPVRFFARPQINTVVLKRP